MSPAVDFAPFAVPPDEIGTLPEAELVVAPTSISQAEQVLDLASEKRLTALVWGGGTHQGLGNRVDADLVISTHRMNRTVDWQAEDLTVTVEAGMLVDDLEVMLAERNQTAVLPEAAGESTVGGVLAAGVSGWRRYRYGATRDRVLEMDIVTGDGRHVRSGARVVKNATGFDLSRLCVGSFGRLGFIAQSCLKLWPLPTAKATVRVDDGDVALAVAHRPQAIVETDGGALVFLGGTEPEVDGQAEALGGEIEDGWIWPEEPNDVVRWSLRVPPSLVRTAIGRLPAGWHYQAGLGTGEIRLASPDTDKADTIRPWAEANGGALVLVDAPPEVYTRLDPWGTPPPSLDIQRNLTDRFDPCRVINPGRLPGGI